MKGRKYDSGKPRWSLLPYKPLKEVVKVLTFGAEKYDDNNWQKVDSAIDRYFSAAMRHITDFVEGEENDKESGIHHLAHAICCLLFWLWFEQKKKE